MPVLENERHELFAQNMALGMDQTAAYEAVYPDSSHEAAMRSASALMRKPEIASRVGELFQKSIAETEASAQWIVERAIELVKRAVEPVPVLDRKGKAIEGEWQYDGRTAVGALALLAKRHKEFSEKHILSGDPENPVTIERRTRSTS